jgi:guanylate kinase
MVRADLPDVSPPLVIVLSGPSGAGKDAMLSHMKSAAIPFFHVTTLTTRPIRPGEKDGRDYHFTSNADFKATVAEGGMLEYAEVYGNWYGVPREPVRTALSRGQDVVIKVDIQGAATIKKLVPEAVFIFLTTPAVSELETRLRERKTETTVDMELRLKTAIREMSAITGFDYVVFNPRDGIDQAVNDIAAIIKAEKCRVNPRRATV